MKTLSVPFLLLLTLLVSVSAVADIALVKTGTFYDDARNGFSSTCFENKKEFTLLEDLSNQDQLAEELKAGSYSMVVAFGPQAASFAKTNTSGTPLVFALVVTPEKVGMKGDNITGVTLVVPLLEEFTILRDINKKIKRIGVIYTQSVNDQLIISARDVASNLNLSLVTAPINSSQDIQRALSELLGKVDALWIPPDPSLISDDIIKAIGAYSLKNQIPCLGPNEKYVRAGAVVSLATDFVEAGKNAGDLANKILAGTPPSKIPVVDQKKLRIIINLKAAGLLGLTIPKNVQNAASKVYQ